MKPLDPVAARSSAPTARFVPALAGDTVLDRTGALDATHLGPPSVPQPPSRRVGSTVRTTVLPRVEATGVTTTFVTSARPRFEARRQLGEGGLGEVIAAQDHDIGREVAIKQLRRDVDGPEATARFVDEIRTVGALEHPNIVPIHDVGENEDGSLYFVMPCVRGETLESIIERLAAGDPIAHAHFTFEKRVHIFRQLLDAVAFAHERGFLHRDIKPANVMVGPFGEVFLMDWGIAKPIAGKEPAALSPAQAATASAPQPSGAWRSRHAGETSIGAVVGTPAYMSPEQASGGAVDVRSDVYSLCVLLYELLGLQHYLHHCTTVEEVFHGVVQTEAKALPFISNPHQSPVPAELGWYVIKGLAKSPADRFQTVEEMIERLDRRGEGDFPIQCPMTFTKRATFGFMHLVDRHPGIYMAGLAVGVLGSVGATIAILVRHFI